MLCFGTKNEQKTGWKSAFFGAVCCTYSPFQAVQQYFEVIQNLLLQIKIRVPDTPFKVMPLMDRTECLIENQQEFSLSLPADPSSNTSITIYKAPFKLLRCFWFAK